MERRMRIVRNNTDTPETTTALRIAFASTDLVHVNQHFGAAQGFVIYLVDMEHAALQEVLQFHPQAQDGNEAKLGEKIALLTHCAAIYCQAVGASAVQQLLAAGVQPVKVSESSSINALIMALQEELRSGPSAWLARAINKIQKVDSRRFDTMAVESWNE
jgi:nitrogen fixation protein NifX